MTDNELKVELARMLPKLLWVNNGFVYWQNKLESTWCALEDTELLYCCHLVEQGLNEQEYRNYRFSFSKNQRDFNSKELDQAISNPLSYTWQQRTTALQQIVNKKV